MHYDENFLPALYQPDQTMRHFRFIASILLTGLYFSTANVHAQTATQAIALGPWQQEGTGSVTGTGDSFTASPTSIDIVDDGDNFDVRNLARHRVFQLFGETVDFSSAANEIQVNFDVTFSGEVDVLDSDFRMSLVDTSTNQGFYPISWDIGGRVGTYSRARFVDNLDGEVGDDHGGTFTDAINAGGTIAQSGAAPEITNDATENGLVDGNTVSFSAVLTRDEGDSFSFTLNVSEADGDVVYPEIAGSYDPVNPTNGDTSVAMMAVNSFDGIVFGVFDDDPFAENPGGSYTVSNLEILATAIVVVGDSDGDMDVDCDDLDSYVGNLDTSVAGSTGLANLDIDGDEMLTLEDANEAITTLVVTSNGITGTFPGDFNCNGTVDVLGDAFILIENLGGLVTMYSEGDANFDGFVDILGDAFILVENLGESNTATP